MNELVFDCVLLAQRSPLENFAREFQGRETRLESGYLTAGVLILVSILVALWLLSKALECYDGRRPVDSALMLFLALCKAHRLPWSDWWLLWRVARDQRLADPARLFLEPERLDQASVGPALRLRAAELKALGERLFAGLPADHGPVSRPSHDDAESRLARLQPQDCLPSMLPIAPRGTPDPAGWPPITPASEDLPPTTFR